MKRRFFFLPCSELLAFGIAALLATNYTLNHFYVHGAYMQDSGWFAYLVAHGQTWPPLNPPAIGGQFFATHFSPGLCLLAWIHALLAHLGLPILEPVWFALTQGLWLGVLASAALSLLRDQNAQEKGPFVVLLIGLSIAIAFNGVSLSILSYPHFELAIPALFLGFFALVRRGYPSLGYGALFLGLMMREDAGLHYFAFFSLAALFSRWAPANTEIDAKIAFWTRLAMGSLGYSLLALALQKGLFAGGDNALGRVYLGDPPWAHLRPGFIEERLQFLMMHRRYLIAPLGLLLVLSLLRRNAFLALGVLAVIPWMILSLVAIAALPGSLTSHYAFPLMMAFFWPLIVSRFLMPPSRWILGPVWDVSLVCLLSISAYGLDSQGNADEAPWQQMGLAWVGQIETSHESLRAFLRLNPDKSFIVDDAVAALLSADVSSNAWRQLLAFSEQSLQTRSGILFKPDTWQGDLIWKLAKAQGFLRPCSLEHSRFAVLSRTDSLKGCDPPRLSEAQPMTPANPRMALLSGWSGGEKQGRWTEGDEVALPLIVVAQRPLDFCIKGRGFLPHPKSEIMVTLMIDDKPIGKMRFTSDDPEGEHCVHLPNPLPDGAPYPAPSLHIEGASSPMALGLSDDRRRLGVFVEQMRLKSP